MRKQIITGLLAVLGIGLLAGNAHALRNLSLRQQGDLPRDQYLDLINPDQVFLDKLVVQFSEDTRVRLNGDRLVSLEGRNLSGIDSFLKSHPEISVYRLFESMTVDELDAYVAKGERMSGWDVADLNNFYLFQIKGANRDAKRLLQDLLKNELVQTCYYEPIATPAVCGSDPAPATPNLVPSQDYREAAPTGVNIDYAWAFDPTYGKGLGTYWFQDLEWGWTETHEDFGNVLITNGPDSGVYNDYSHGTAVMSIVGACDDAKGVSGLVPNTRLTARVVSNHASTADALIAIGNQLLAGETYLIEMHAGGPSQGTACTCNCGQFQYIAMEYWTANYNAILANSAAGKTCIEAAGNGSMDLDWAGYGGAFNLGVRDSGAIMVGAGTSGSVHNPECWTNHGSRISAMGWGDGVYAAAYGDAFNPAGDDQDYTASFSGTSSASPIVAGSAISLALIHRYQNGSYMNPWDLRSRLTTNGTPQGPTDTWKEINVLPNLKGILAPDLTAYNPGWDNVIVPSDVGGTSVLPASLPPAPATTYFDWAWVNWSHYATIGAYQNHLLQDDAMVAFNNMGSHPKFWYYATSDFGIQIRGGLHYMRLFNDQSGVVDESIESNNNATIGYSWAPTALASNTPQAFTRGCKRNPQGYSYTAMDGYSNGGAPGWWDVTGVMPTGTADYDMALYTGAVTPTSGWTTSVAGSGAVGSTDFVGSNHNAVGDANNFGVINWADSNENYTVEREASTGIGSPPAIPSLISSNSLATGEILDVYEMYALNLNPIQFALDITSGNADVAIHIYGPSSTYFGRFSSSWTLNSAGNGGDEAGTFTPTATGWHGIVVCKNLSNQLSEYADYGFYWGPPTGDYVHTLLPGWTDMVVANNASGTNGILPAVLDEGPSYGESGLLVAGSGPLPAGANQAFYLDGFQVYQSVDFPYTTPGVTGNFAFRPLGDVKGGRHELGSYFDVNSEVAEELPQGENNNAYFTQYAWAPHGLTPLVPELRTPAPNWANFNNPTYWSLAGFNQDGYVLSTTYWSGLAAMPWDATEQLNVHVYDNTDNGSTTALLNPVTSNYPAPGEISFVLSNGNTLGYGSSRNAGVTNNWAYPYTIPSLPYAVQLSPWQGDLQPYAIVHNTLTNGAGGGQILHTYDMYMIAGQSYPVNLFNNSGVDLGLAIFNAGEGTVSLNSAAAVFNANGAAQNEVGTFTATTSGFHGVAVYRTRSTDLGVDAPYGLSIGSWAAQTIGDLDITIIDPDGTDDVIDFSLDWSDVTMDNNGNPLAVDHYNCYYSLSNGGGWMLFAMPTSSEIGPLGAYIVGNPVFLFRVTAVDDNGTLLASTLPADGELGTTLVAPTSGVLGLPAGMSLPATGSAGTDR